MYTPDRVIETRGLTKSYKGVEALKSLDLKVAQNTMQDKRANGGTRFGDAHGVQLAPKMERRDCRC